MGCVAFLIISQLCYCSVKLPIDQWFPTFLAPGTSCVEDNISMDQGGGWFGDDSNSHYIYCALYFSYYYIRFTSDHQALDPRGWGPLIYETKNENLRI